MQVKDLPSLQGGQVVELGSRKPGSFTDGVPAPACSLPVLPRVLLLAPTGLTPCALCSTMQLFARKYARAADLYCDAIFLEILGDESKDNRVSKHGMLLCLPVRLFLCLQMGPWLRCCCCWRGITTACP